MTTTSRCCWSGPTRRVAAAHRPAGTRQGRPRGWSGPRRRLDALRAWHEPASLVDAAELAVSELVTNALRYGAGQVSLQLSRHDDGVVVEVEDEGIGTPRRRRAAADEEGGRGLLLVGSVRRRLGRAVRAAAEDGLVPPRAAPALRPSCRRVGSLLAGRPGRADEIALSPASRQRTLVTPHSFPWGTSACACSVTCGPRRRAAPRSWPCSIVLGAAGQAARVGAGRAGAGAPLRPRCSPLLAVRAGRRGAHRPGGRPDHGRG